MSRYCVLLPVAAGRDASTDSRVRSLLSQTLSDWKCYVVPDASGASAAEEFARAAGDPRFIAAPAGLDTLARLLNWAIANGGGELILPLPERIVLHPGALERFAQVFAANDRAASAFSSYEEQKADGSKEKVTLYPHEGAPHERFDFGYVRVYRTSILKELGGYREDLVHAAEYDMDLKIGDAHTIELVEEPLYTVEPAPAGAEQAEAPSSALHSPGKGKLGGFSYIFYPPDLEKEITGVFEEMLRRRGAWIDHETVPVQYPAEPYEVMASVVIPVLNRARFIGNAIERVLEGTYKNFEVVVVDNGSTDGTQDVVREWAAKDSRVRLIQRSGGSIASALNEGIRNARGKYICQLDSDDEYTPDTLELMVGHMESHPKCGLAISYYELMDENRNKVEGIDPVTHSGYTRNQILRRDGAGALRVFPKVVLEEMGYYDEENFGNFGEDYDMVLKVGEKYDVDRVHKVLYRYRRHGDNTDVTRDPLMKVRNKNNARLNALRRRQELNRRLAAEGKRS